MKRKEGVYLLMINDVERDDGEWFGLWSSVNGGLEVHMTSKFTLDIAMVLLQRYFKGLPCIMQGLPQDLNEESANES